MRERSTRSFSSYFIFLASLAIPVLVIFIAVKQLSTGYASSPVESLSESSPSTSSTTPEPSATSTPTNPITPNVTSAASSGNITNNWAGYDATGGVFSGVSGSWTIPEVTGSDETSADATWIGVGGVSTNDLIQVGTQNVIAANGQVTASAFYELLPDVSQSLPGVSVNPGDAITASLTETSSGIWTISLTDTTDGSSYSGSVPYASSESSAEWIEEDPSGAVNQIPFDNFGTVAINSGSATLNGNSVTIAGANGEALTMVNSAGQVLASTSTLGSDGASFSVTRSSAASVSASEQFNSDPGSWRRRGSGIGRALGENYLNF